MLDERLNRAPARNAAYVGDSAFAHKGGAHVSAVEKDPRTYEHIDPELVGNRRHIVDFRPGWAGPTSWRGFARSASTVHADEDKILPGWSSG